MITVGGLSDRFRPWASPRLGGVAAQHLHQAVVGDLDHLVGRSDRADHRLAGGRFLGLGNELAHDRQGDVGLEQGHADLAQGLVDILLRQDALAAEAVKDAGEPIC